MELNKIRILHGPFNFSGIGGYVANFQRERGMKSDCLVYHSKKMFPHHHLNLHLDKIPVIFHPFIIAPFFIYCLLKYNLFHFYGGKSFFILNLDLPILKFFGKKIIMTYTGSDIRLIEPVEKKRNPYWHLLKLDTTSSKPNKLKIKWLQDIKDYFVFGYNHPKFDNRKMKMMKFHDNGWIK